MIEIVVYRSDSVQFTAYLKRRPDISTEGPTEALALVSLAAVMIEIQNEEGAIRKNEGNA